VPAARSASHLSVDQTLENTRKAGFEASSQS
jgi:hypothetical protein